MSIRLKLFGCAIVETPAGPLEGRAAHLRVGARQAAAHRVVLAGALDIAASPAIGQDAGAFGGQPTGVAITAEECLAAVAVFRLMMPGAHIFVMGGREVNLGDRQHLIFRAGANGTMVGNYLTSAGRPPSLVVDMVAGQGLKLRGPEDGRPWAFHGQAPGEANWNRRALEGGRPGAKLPVVR